MTTPIQPTAAVALLRISASVLRGNGNSTSDEVYSVADLIDATADLIETMAAQIERMRAALRQARTVVAVDRESFVQCNTAPALPLDPDDQDIVDEYDGLLRQIDEAMETR